VFVGGFVGRHGKLGFDGVHGVAPRRSRRS